MALKTIYHLHLKDQDKDLYYGSIKAITDHNTHGTLGVGIDTLYRVDWKKGYDNDQVKIKKGVLHTTNSVVKKKRRKKK